MGESDAEFREFAGAFGEPLTRLAYLLLAGIDPAGDDRDQQRACERVVRALATARRHWRDASSSGSPEIVAIEAIFARLPRAPTRAAASPDINAVNESDSTEKQKTDEKEMDDDALLDAMWRAWTTLPPAERAALLFDDVSVASRQLQRAAAPDSVGSSRRRRSLERAAWAKLRTRLAADPAAAAQHTKLARAGHDLDTLLTTTLSRYAAKVPACMGAGPRALALAGRARRRFWVAAAAITAIAVALTVVTVSAARHRAQVAAEKAANAEKAGAASSSPSGSVRTTTDRRVVDWPARGELRGDATLMSNLRTAFVADHPDATSDVQVLLATDTPSFRVAYLTARSRQGVIESWFYGPLGAQQLTEGAFSYGPNVAHGAVIAAALSDPDGHSVLVVIGPPETTRIMLTDSGPAEVADASFDAVSQNGGIAVRDVSRNYLPFLFMRVFEGADLAWNRGVPVIQLGKREPDLPPVTVERGAPDPAVLARAMRIEADWARTGELSAGGQAVALWGGVDDTGQQLVVLRVKTLHLADLLIVAWPDGDGEYLLAPDLPDYPLGFAYSTPSGPRVGVLAAPGVASARFAEDGVTLGSRPVDATGFTSIAVNSPYQALAQREFAVQLYDAAGRQVSALPVPPQV